MAAVSHLRNMREQRTRDAIDTVRNNRAGHTGIYKNVNKIKLSTGKDYKIEFSISPLLKAGKFHNLLPTPSKSQCF